MRTFLTILFLTAAACAQEPASTSASKAIVHFYRERSYYGSIRKMPIFMDEQQIADLVNGRFFVAKLEPGKHVFRCRTKLDAIAVELVGGQEYYLRAEVIQGFAKFFLDGHDWEMMPDVFSKGMYVQGLMDGLSQAAATINSLPITQETILESRKAVGLDQITPKKAAPLSQTVEAIDLFYSDARNALVSIPVALRWAKVKLDGDATPENLAGFASYLRTNSKERRPPIK